MTATGSLSAGFTEHFLVEYDDSLGRGEARSLATGLLQTCEGDLELLSRWLGGRELENAPVRIRVGGAGAASDGAFAGSGELIELPLSAGDPPQRVRFLFACEVAKLLMPADRGPAAREGMALFLAGQVLAVNTLGPPPLHDQPANSWMQSERADYISGSGDDAPPEVRSGCAVLFLYYLFAQLRYSVIAIAATDASDVAGIYTQLTGDVRNPFLAFRDLLDRRFPGTTPIPGTHPDNPWPIGRLLEDAVGEIHPLPASRPAFWRG